MAKEKRVFEVNLMVRIPILAPNETHAQSLAELYVQEKLEELHEGVQAEAMSAAPYLREDEYYDKESFDKEIAEAHDQDNVGYDQYVVSMSYANDPVISRDDYMDEEAKLRKKYYTQVLNRMSPENVVIEIAKASKNLNQQFDKFPAQEIAEEILNKRGGTPSDKQLESLINIYVSYLLEEGFVPDVMN